MAKNKNKSKNNNSNNKQKPKRGQNVVVRAPTSQSVRRTTQNSGERQTILLFDVKKGLNNYDLVPAKIPWLKGIAPSYQRWKLNNVRIWYEPRVSTATNGTVAMAVQRDFQDGTPTSRESLVLSGGAVRAAVWDQCSLGVQSGPLREYCSLSSFNGLSPTDKNDRALGRVFCWADVDSDMTAGYVYMSYSPEFQGPVDPATQAEG